MAETDAYRREVTDLVEAGWEIESETPERTTLVRRNFGSAKAHLVIGVLTFWWFLGVPNALYAAYKYFSDSERTVVWKDRKDRTRRGEPTVKPADVER